MSIQKISILVVEDDQVSAPIACALLDRLGCAATIATNGAQAVQSFRRAKYDLILMDWQMPVMDGFEATMRIRTMPGGREIPIVGTTAPMGRADCLSAGMDDLMAKPFDLEKLRGTVAKWITNRKDIFAGGPQLLKKNEPFPLPISWETALEEVESQRVRTLRLLDDIEELMENMRERIRNGAHWPDLTK
jgi:two-component system sensor histidine kinase/response regulator